MAKAMSLLKAYMSESIPVTGGFIISSFFEGDTTYCIFEITAYANVKDIYKTPEGLTFKTDGNRAHVLVEPPTYSRKHIEPVFREDGKSIPYRFNEMEILTGQKQEKIMISKEPIMLHSSFTILASQGDNFSFLFFPTPDVYIAIRKFMSDVFYNDARLMKVDAIEGAKVFVDTVKKFTVWSD
ncbi:MAG TPA: hypothetical protein PK200_00300 [Spirochaetota bacterium]|nr:hypothetical protein [Spirochaetota bacterium]HQP49191.1 hypothetical protein [Spirochaetota bacterium]